MKRFSLILLVCIYALSSLGIGVKQFYCCGKLKYTHLSMVQNAREKCADGNEKNGCCQTKFRSLKVNDTHVASAYTNCQDKFFINILFYPPLQILPLASQAMDIFYAGNAPPSHHGIPIYILYSVYLI